MKSIVHFEPLTTNKYKTYIEVGTKAYNQHYLHLWPNEDSSPYISTSFTESVLKKEEKDNNTLLFLIHYNKKTVGVIKITLSSSLDNYSSKESLYINKIYILKEYTGIGIGHKALNFIQLRAIEFNKKIIWLYTMQKGPALHFYLKNGYRIFKKRMLPFTDAIETEKPMFVMLKEI